jgi:DNA-binding IclR family transcriptional regulator
VTPLDANETRVVKSADRVLDILELLAEEPRGLTISEIGEKLGVARSSTHGLVHNLLWRGYLTLDHPRDRRFRLGARLIHLGLAVMDRVDLRSAARAPLERLVEATGSPAYIAVPDRGELVYVDKLAPARRDIAADLRIGVRRPIHCSSLGKALLAALDEGSASAIVSRIDLAPATDHTITEPDDLVADLARTRARGWSIDHQEAVLGVSCAGAPIRDHSGRAIAAVSVSTFCDGFDAARAGPAVARAAVEISHALGWTGAADTLYAPVAGNAELILAETAESRARHAPVHEAVR